MAIPTDPASAPELSSASTTVHSVGDSTTTDEDPGERPETDYGASFGECFDEDVTVENHAPERSQ